MYLEHRLRWWSERWGTLITQSSGLARAKTRVDRVIISISWRLTSHCHCLQRFINGKLGGLCFLIPCWNFEYAHLTPKHQESKSGVCVCVRASVYVGAIHSNKKIQKVATSPKGKSTGGSVSSGRRYSPSGLRLAQSMAEVSTSSDGCRMFTSGKLQNDQMIRQTCRILQPLIHQMEF
jgi:hypothetical protein